MLDDASSRATAPYAAILALLLVLFLLRVAGQLAVVAYHVPWLPPMVDWYSGLLPYRALLPAQIALAAVMAAVTLDFARGEGPFVEPRRAVGVVLAVASAIYFAAMILRASLRIRRREGRRWYEAGTIPTAFHFVLASYLLTFALWHLRAS
ncbi:MAG TPA: hypothetical protein VGR85_08825 [Candidatus Limnocylindria bacterium]|jgi:hypothetical protein|nr:hypothetical protein [Candidatus Limnocylindria bacterium]